MRWVFALLCSTSFVLSLAAAARAQSTSSDAAREHEQDSPSFLSVTREEGAESCPDTDALKQHVERLRGHPTTGEPSSYRVSFMFRNRVYRADIQVGSGSGVRILRDRGSNCASLEQATAVTLALLLDSDAHELPPEKAVPEPTEPPELPPPEPLVPAPSPDQGRTAVHLSVSLGGGGLFGVVQPIAPVALGELGIGVNRFRTSVGMLWMPSQTLDFGPGQIRETLVSGVARTCLAAARSKQVRFDLCTGIYAGLLKVRAEGYTRNDTVDKAWLALPLEVSLSTMSTPVGVEIGASALVPLRRNDFSIDNLGVAYGSWPVGLLLSMRAVGSWLL
jgi:hypothetical protein